MFVDGLIAKHPKNVPSWNDYLNPEKVDNFKELRKTAESFLHRLTHTGTLFDVDGGKAKLADFQNYVKEIQKSVRKDLPDLMKITDLTQHHYYSDTLFVMDSDSGNDDARAAPTLETFMKVWNKKRPRVRLLPSHSL